MSGEAL